MNELLSHAPDAPWEQIALHLDSALGDLNEADRDALLLRYFERKSAQEMAQMLGVSEDAAQKRVSRAVDRLREFLAKRGVTAGASGLVVLISTNAVLMAPTGLSAAIAGAGFAAGSAALTQATILTMKWVNVKTAVAILATAFIAGTSVYFIQQHTLTRAAATNGALMATQQQLVSMRDEALATARATQQEAEKLRNDVNDLPRLRGEVMRLRAAVQEAVQLKTGDLPTVGKSPLVAGLVINHIGRGAVAGADKLNDESVRTNILVKVGNSYSRFDIDRDVRGLYGTGLFTNVRVTEEKTNEDFILTYTVQDKPQAIYASIGAATPEAGLQRLLAASKMGDTNSVTAFLGWQRGEGVSDEMVDQMHRPMTRNTIGTLTNTASIRIVNQQMENNDAVRARVESVDQNGKVRLVELRLLREGDEWKPAINIYRSKSGSYGAMFGLPLTPELGPTNQ